MMWGRQINVFGVRNITNQNPNVYHTKPPPPLWSRFQALVKGGGELAELQKGYKT